MPNKTLPIFNERYTGYSGLATPNKNDVVIPKPKTVPLSFNQGQYTGYNSLLSTPVDADDIKPGFQRAVVPELPNPGQYTGFNNHISQPNINDVSIKRWNYNFTKPKTNTTRENVLYKRNSLLNGIMSYLRHYPTADSVQQYIEKKKNTPDMSDYKHARDYALRPTNVLRSTANHITGNIKFNPYDTTAQANATNAQTANAINTVSRQGSGKLNVLLNNISNMLSNGITTAGNQYMAGWQANEKQRMAVAEANREADKFNAIADNEAENNYINSRNQAAVQDKKNAIDALNTYADKKYGINSTYENQLRGLRDQMVSNVAEEGREAYENNRANTNKEFNYWYDLMGRMHFIPQEGGARYVAPQNPEPYKIADGDFAKVLDKYKNDNAIRDELYRMMNTNGYARGRYDWYNKYKQA